MTREEAISFGTDRLELFGGQMDEFIKMSVEALKEQRPKGYWISTEENNPMYFCSNCKHLQNHKSNYCEICGYDNRERCEVES